VRSRVERVFAAQKSRLGLVIRTVGMVSAQAKIGLGNLAYNFTRLAWLNGRTAPVLRKLAATRGEDQPDSFVAALISLKW
jgi:hypothetical protein